MEAALESRTVSLAIPAKPDYVVLARLALSAVCRLTPLTPEEIADLKLAITESATYLMGGERRRASRDDGAQAATIRFMFTLADEALEVVVTGDQLPTVSPEERELSVALIQATVDEHHFADGEMRFKRHLRRAAE